MDGQLKLGPAIANTTDPSDCIYQCDAAEQDLWPTYASVIIGVVAALCVVSLAIYLITERRYKKRRLSKAKSEAEDDILDSKRPSLVNIMRSLAKTSKCRSSELLNFYTSGPCELDKSALTPHMEAGDGERRVSVSTITSVRVVDETAAAGQEVLGTQDLRHI